MMKNAMNLGVSFNPKDEKTYLAKGGVVTKPTMSVIG